MNKYQIELNEEQLYLIAHCVEDIHRFMGGQTELSNCTSSLDECRELRNKLRELQPLVICLTIQVMDGLEAIVLTSTKER